jgi:hypothetical protein
MSTTMQVPAFETGVIRLFAIDMPSDQMDAFDAKVALGATSLDETFVDVFPISDLEGLGLAGYLITGGEVPEEQVDEMRVQLNAIKGHVLLVFSSAFGKDKQTLYTHSPLRHIATFFTEGTPVIFKKLPDDSAQLGTGNDENKPAKKVPSQAAMSGRIATYALLFMFAFTGLIIWIGS